MLTANVIYHADTRTLEIQDISTGMDTVVVGTQGDDRTSKIHFIMDGNVSSFNEFYAEFDVKVPDQTKHTYIKPAIRLNGNRDVILPSYVLSNVIKGVLPMQLSMLNTTTDIKAVSVNTVFFRVAEAIDADLSTYNVIVPEPVTTTAGVFTAVVGDGITSEFTLIHNLDTYDVGAWAYYNDTHASIPVEWQMESEDSITVYLPNAPSELNATIVVYRAGNGIYENVVDVFPVSSVSELTTRNHAKVGDLAYHKAVNDDDDTIIWTLMAEPYSTADNWQMTYTSGVDKGLQDEIERATAAETALGTRITNEATRATNAETALGTRITNECNAVHNEVVAVSTQLGSEVDRAVTAERALDNKIDTVNGSAVHIAGEETITGAKTFSEVITGGDGINITGNSAITGALAVTGGITGDLTGTASVATKLGEANVGSSTNPIFLNGGTATPSSATVGTATKPVYLSEGVITEGTQLQSAAYKGAVNSISSQATNNDVPTSKAVQDFVNSSIGTATANFLGTFKALADPDHPDTSLGFTQVQVDAMKDPYASESTLATALASKFPSDPTDPDYPSPNDYVFVEMDFTVPETSPDEYRRYKWGPNNADPPVNQWMYEYTLNNSSFTQAQWDAINSGIDSQKVSSYEAHIANTSNPHSVTKAQVGLGSVQNYGMDSAPTSGSNNYVKSGGVYSALSNKIGSVSSSGPATGFVQSISINPSNKTQLDVVRAAKPEITLTNSGSGDVITGLSVDPSNGHAITVFKNRSVPADIPSPSSGNPGQAIIINEYGSGFTLGEAGKVDDVRINGNESSNSIVRNKIAVIPLKVTKIPMTEVD